MKPWRAAALTTVMWMNASQTAPAASEDMERLRSCAGHTEDAKRLACFDDAVRDLSAPRFIGRLSETTSPFRVDGPTRLRYQSDGAIFVLYLKDANGEIVQNLHLGGGGEDDYLIERAGTYSLHINGSETWRIWLEPWANGSERKNTWPTTN